MEWYIEMFGEEAYKELVEFEKMVSAYENGVYDPDLL